MPSRFMLLECAVWVHGMSWHKSCCHPACSNPTCLAVHPSIPTGVSSNASFPSLLAGMVVVFVQTTTHPIPLQTIHPNHAQCNPSFHSLCLNRLRNTTRLFPTTSQMLCRGREGMHRIACRTLTCRTCQKSLFILPDGHLKETKR